MNYKKIYNKIIIRASKENRRKKQGIYYEKHHIIPKCLKGSNEKENLVLLTAREHFLCHWLLVRMYPRLNKIVTAFSRMCNINLYQEKRKVNSHLFKYAREYLVKYFSSRIISTETRNRMSIAKKNKPLSLEHRQKIGKSNKGKTKGRVCSEDTINKIKKARRTQIITKEHKMKISQSMLGDKNHFYGKTHSNEARNKIRMSKEIPIICLDTLKIYNSIKLACEDVKICNNYIIDCCKKRRDSYRGLRFCYLKNYKERSVENV